VATSESDEGDDDPEAVPPSRLSEKARGKKRMREEDSDCSSPDDDDSDDDPFAAGGSGSNSRRDGPDHKRRKTDGDTRINTDRLDLSPCERGTNSTRFMNDLITLPERRRNSEKLKFMERMYRASQSTRR
jgi:hypothetical protein